MIYGNKAPNSVEEALDELEAIKERLGSLKLVPFEESIMLTHEFLQDFCKRIVALEKQGEKK